MSKIQLYGCDSTKYLLWKHPNDTYRYINIIIIKLLSRYIQYNILYAVNCECYFCVKVPLAAPELVPLLLAVRLNEFDGDISAFGVSTRLLRLLGNGLGRVFGRTFTTAGSYSIKTKIRRKIWVNISFNGFECHGINTNQYSMKKVWIKAKHHKMDQMKYIKWTKNIIQIEWWNEWNLWGDNNRWRWWCYRCCCLCHVWLECWCVAFRWCDFFLYRIERFR